MGTYITVRMGALKKDLSIFKGGNRFGLTVTCIKYVLTFRSTGNFVCFVYDMFILPVGTLCKFI